jgi:hypothetical protein
VYKIDTPSYYPKYLYGANQDSKYLVSSVRIDGVASVGSTIDVAGKITSFGGYLGSYIYGATVQRGSVFSAMASYIPVTGNTILVSGGIGSFVYPIATRTSSTEITFSGVVGGGTGTVGTLIATSGSISSFSGVALSW